MVKYFLKEGMAAKAGAVHFACQVETSDEKLSACMLSLVAPLLTGTGQVLPVSSSMAFLEVGNLLTVRFVS